MKKLFYSLILTVTILFALFAPNRLSNAQEQKTDDEKIKPERAKQISLELLSQLLVNRNIGTANDLKVEKVEIDDLGMAHTRVRQTVDAIPVWEGEAIIHLKPDGSLSTITNDLKESVTVNTKPILSAEDAARIANDLYTGAAQQSGGQKIDLWIYRAENRDHLVYRVETPRIDGSNNPAIPVDFIDAHNGIKIFGYDNLQSGSGLSIYSGTVPIGTSFNGQLFLMENPSRRVGTFDANFSTTTYFRYTDTNDFWDATYQRPGVDAHFGAETALSYYQTVHNRNGMDGFGGPGYIAAATNGVTLISSFVRYGIGYNNAAWTGSYLLYGDGDGFTFLPWVTTDLCGHEFTHGVTQYTAGLIYANESGALNESMSDVFGTMIERYARPTTWNWKFAEEAYIAGDALRYLYNPHLAVNNGFTPDDDPDHYSERYLGTQDNGGVHINSGIPNHVFYLVAQGGTHHSSGVSVTGIGADNAARIWYRALAFYMTSGTNFAAARTATLNAAADLFGVSSAQYNAVAAGWCAVGVGACSPSSCQTLPISVGQTVTGSLQSGDCLYTDNSYYDAYTFSGTAGQQIYITLNSAQFNAYLFLIQGNYPGGTSINQDNNGGGGTNARIPATSGFRTLPATGTYTILANSFAAGETGSYTLFLGSSVPPSKKPFDFDGDSKTDVSIFRPSNGQWWINRSSNNQTVTAQFGASSDRLVPADYTGDGKADVAVWRPSTGQWFIVRSENSSFYAFPFGSNNDIPAPGDFDGDGRADAAVFRPSNATWYILRSSDGGITITPFGISEDKPVVADYDGDGKADIAIFRPSNSQWWLLRSTAGVQAVQFGQAGDKTVQGDYTGDGKADIAFWRPSNGNWFILRSENNTFYAFPFGLASDLAVPGDYDGDGKFDAAVFRPSNSTWYLQRTLSGFTAITFGIAGDYPIPNVFVR